MKRAALGLAALVTAHLAAQQGVIRSTVIGVRLVAHVRVGSQPVSDLTPGDFAVTDAGVSQQVDAARLAEGVSVALLIDTSFSTRRFRPLYAAELAAAAKVTSALTSRDRVVVLTVSDHATVVQTGTPNGAALDAAVRQLAAAPMGFTQQTALWDGIMVAASQSLTSNGVPAVLAITDGKDNSSWLSRAEVGRLLEREGVAVDVVGQETPGTFLIFGFDDYALGPIETPDDITHDSGGQYFDANDKNLAAKLKARFDQLRASYVLTYTPRGVKNDDGWHAVTVKVPNRNVTVKAQAGYYAGKYSPKPETRP